MLIDFVISLPILKNKERNDKNLIFIKINIMTRIIYYKQVKTTIDIIRYVKISINIVVKHYDFLDLMVRNRNSLFTSNFGSFLCSFLYIK